MARRRSHRRSSRKPPRRAARSRSRVADKLHVDIVTVEGRRFRGDADFVVAPGSEGELGVLPRHIPLLTPLAPGSVRVCTSKSCPTPTRLLPRPLWHGQKHGSGWLSSADVDEFEPTSNLIATVPGHRHCGLLP